MRYVNSDRTTCTGIPDDRRKELINQAFGKFFNCRRTEIYCLLHTIYQMNIGYFYVETSGYYVIINKKARASAVMADAPVLVVPDAFSGGYAL